MINILSINGHIQYDIYELICDTEADVEHLTKKCGVGSTAFVIETKNVYMLNGEKKWVKI